MAGERGMRDAGSWSLLSLNYRHAFHAGNFADLVKHAGVLALLPMLQGKAPLRVIDTHAGRGAYDLAGVEAKKSGEAEAGIVRLMAASDAPAVFEPLTAAVRALNPQGGVTRYPGSPLLIAGALRPADHYLACELRPEEHAALAALMKPHRNVRTACADGYQALEADPPKGPTLVLIDPPFERADDYRRTADAIAGVRADNAEAVVLAWLPLKDLETFDGFLRMLEDDVDAPMLAAETRMRPLTDPMKMNGCALVLVGGPEAMKASLQNACAWTAETLGQGGEARIYAV